MSEQEPVVLDISNDPHIMFVPAPLTIPKQTDTLVACLSVSASVINHLVGHYDRKWLFDNMPEGKVCHSDLLMLMKKRADNSLRVRIAEVATRVLTPVIRYEELFLPTNKRSMQENQVIINDIQNQMMAALDEFNIAFKTM